jgi:hypothetical protein
VQQAVKLTAQGERAEGVAASFHLGRTTLYRVPAVTGRDNLGEVLRFFSG